MRVQGFAVTISAIKTFCLLGVIFTRNIKRLLRVSLRDFLDVIIPSVLVFRVTGTTSFESLRTLGVLEVLKQPPAAPPSTTG